MASPRGPREPIAGPDIPEPPFPLYLSGKVIKGFGRGSKELGIPTANIPIEGLSVGGHSDLESGVYYGWAGLDFHDSSKTTTASTTTTTTTTDVKILTNGSSASSSTPTKNIYPMAMSIGWNPFYKNTVRSVEVHIMHAFARDFYGSHLNLVVLGFIRPELDYVSKEALIDDIRTDIDVALRSLARPAYAALKKDPYLLDFPKDEHGNVLKDDVAK
ncbi:riboflavin kinase-domain-containing protein [Phyllosticta citriasiana]|uniref:riboflavin kinase-domain-containing protein n=1 Tax=Phyllosticta citriasiana TaxID=595635 RepID=UPI0030FDE220